MIIGLDENINQIHNDYINEIKDNTKINDRIKCIILRALFEQYCYHFLLISNIINYKINNNNKIVDNLKKFKKDNAYNEHMFEGYVNDELAKIKMLWPANNKENPNKITVMKLIWKFAFNEDPIFEKILNDFHSNFYKIYLTNSHHRKKFQINKTEFASLTKEMNNLFTKHFVPNWLNSSIEVLECSKQNRKMHIKQLGTTFCAAKPNILPLVIINEHKITIKDLLKSILKNKELIFKKKQTDLCVDFV